MSKSISTSLIKELRLRTNAGIVNCKKALIACNGNVDEAATWLRKQGILKAAAQAHRETSEGVAHAFVGNNKVVLFVLNTETDFGARNREFQKLVEKVTGYLTKAEDSKIENALATTIQGESLQDVLHNAMAIIKENIVLAQLIVLPKTPEQSAAVYNHFNHKVATACIFSGKIASDVAANIAMQIAAMNPQFINPSDVDEAWLTREKAIISEQIANNQQLQSKSPVTRERIINGRINKSLAEICLVTQPLLTNPQLLVSDVLKSNQVRVIAMESIKI